MSAPIAVALLAALTLTGSAQSAQEVSVEVTAELDQADVLRSPRGQAIWILRSIREPEPPLADPVSDLTELVALTADDLVSYLRDRRVPALEDKPSQTMSIYQHELILDAFGRSEPTTILAATSRMLKASSSESTVAAAIEAYGATGEAAQLRRIRTLLEGLPEDGWGKQLELSLQTAVASILRDDHKAQGQLLTSWRSWKPEHLASVIRGVGTARDPRGLEFLGKILYWEPDHSLLVLSQLRLLGTSGVEAIDDPITRKVRGMLATEDDRIRKAALLALGELRDLESVPRMIEILSEESAGERANAIWALERITGVQLNDQAATWKTWYDMESKWYSRSGLVMKKLSSADDFEVFGAIRELSTHYLHKPELAEAISTCLTHSNASIRTAACKGLDRLKSRVAVPVLIARLDDRNERVQLAARKALISLTGEERGPHAEDWKDLKR